MFGNSILLELSLLKNFFDYINILGKHISLKELEKFSKSIIEPSGWVNIYLFTIKWSFFIRSFYFPRKNNYSFIADKGSFGFFLYSTIIRHATGAKSLTI